jgi:hypothetical protein
LSLEERLQVKISEGEEFALTDSENKRHVSSTIEVDGVLSGAGSGKVAERRGYANFLLVHHKIVAISLYG